MKKLKAITFSFDDGNADDVRIIGIMNKYNLKGTFDLSSGQITKSFEWDYSPTKKVYHINYFDSPNLYDGHEIACHSYNHPHLEKLDKATVDNEIRIDKKILEFLYNKPVRGMAYPFGTYSNDVIDILIDNEIEYSRTVESSYNFNLPENPLNWHPTCHFKDKRIFELAKDFLDTDYSNDAVFYIWGHSYELDGEEEWQKFDDFCRYIANRRDVSYCTNIEIIDYMNRKNSM